MTTRPFLALGLCLALGLAVFGVQVGRAVKLGREFDRYLSVKGLSEKEEKANLAIWPIHFSVSAEDLGQLKENMESSRQIVLDFLKEHGFDSKEITFGLPTVNDRIDERTRKSNLVRYRGTVTLVVRSSNVDTVKKAIQEADGMLSKGVTLEEGQERVEFIFNALNEVKPGMIKDATANARAAAEKFALDSHATVGRIRHAAQGEFEIENRDAASPEWKRLRVVTTVDFFLE